MKSVDEGKRISNRKKFYLKTNDIFNLSLIPLVNIKSIKTGKKRIDSTVNTNFQGTSLNLKDECAISEFPKKQKHAIIGNINYSNSDILNLKILEKYSKRNENEDNAHSYNIISKSNQNNGYNDKTNKEISGYEKNHVVFSSANFNMNTDNNVNNINADSNTIDDYNNRNVKISNSLIKNIHSRNIKDVYYNDNIRLNNRANDVNKNYNSFQNNNNNRINEDLLKQSNAFDVVKKINKRNIISQDKLRNNNKDGFVIENNGLQIVNNNRTFVKPINLNDINKLNNEDYDSRNINRKADYEHINNYNTTENYGNNKIKEEYVGNNESNFASNQISNHVSNNASIRNKDNNFYANNNVVDHYIHELNKINSNERKIENKNNTDHTDNTFSNKKNRLLLNCYNIPKYKYSNQRKHYSLNKNNEINLDKRNDNYDSYDYNNNNNIIVNKQEEDYKDYKDNYTIINKNLNADFNVLKKELDRDTYEEAYNNDKKLSYLKNNIKSENDFISNLPSIKKKTESIKRENNQSNTNTNNINSIIRRTDKDDTKVKTEYYENIRSRSSYQKNKCIDYQERGQSVSIYI